MKADFRTAVWVNEPRESRVTADAVEIVTDHGTDFWQRSYYGFRNDNAHALVLERDDNFTFECRASFDYRERFDQCGLVVYEDSENWFKASIEHETADLARLGSVVTNVGYSDWATVDIGGVTSLWYRLSRRGPDFLVERAFEGEEHHQMRVFHLHVLGETTPEMGHADPPLPPERPVHVGVYACSPVGTGFRARFTDLTLTESIWRAHE